MMLLIYFSFTTKSLQEQNPEPYLIKLYATGKELHANTVGNILQKASISYTHFAIFHLKGKLSWFALKSWFPMPSANDNSAWPYVMGIAMIETCIQGFLNPAESSDYC